MKYLLVLIFLSCLIFSCTINKERKEQKQNLSDSNTNNTDSTSILEITPTQEFALDALNKLQVNTDEMNRIYSTFPDIVHPCFPPDTSFIISQSELLIAMGEFMKDNTKYLSVEMRDKLVKSAVLAQEEYKVLHCKGTSQDEDYENGLPASGTWVMPNILGKRDVVLVW